MNEKIDVQDILKSLCEAGIVSRNCQLNNKMSGTTDGLVYTLTVSDEPTYVLKFDTPNEISAAKQLLVIYKNSKLIPKVIYTDPSNRFMIYTYIKGTTHYNRGSKLNWLTLLVKDLLNRYVIYHQTDKWGRLELPRESWREFNERSLEGARLNVRNLLPIEDYDQVRALIDRISQVQEKYLLHGDTGVHNFVFHDHKLTGVIDPSPMVGPVIYDFTYAFCSSPDDLDLDTLFAAYRMLNHMPMDRSRLIEEVIFQLYCRIGICAKHHPHDLEDYLKAWKYWRGFLSGEQSP
jgi:Phosphotransferase enzyme family